MVAVRDREVSPGRHRNLTGRSWTEVRALRWILQGTSDGKQKEYGVGREVKSCMYKVAFFACGVSILWWLW